MNGAWLAPPGAGPAGGDGGQTVVLLPGLFQSAKTWVDVGFAGALSCATRVLALDGLSRAAVHGGVDAEDALAADVLAVLDRHGVGRAHLMGYDVGAWLAGVVAFRFPDRVGSVVSGGFGPSAGRAWSRSLAAPLVAGAWGVLWARASLGDDRFWRTPLPRVDRSSALALLRTVSESAPPAGDELYPSLVYAGALDPLANDAVVDAEQRGAVATLLGGEGHWGAFVAVDTVVALVRSHLAVASVGT